MIFILRHGERADDSSEEEFNKIEIQHDPHLTEVGKKQAEKAGRVIK